MWYNNVSQNIKLILPDTGFDFQRSCRAIPLAMRHSALECCRPGAFWRCVTSPESDGDDPMASAWVPYGKHGHRQGPSKYTGGLEACFCCDHKEINRLFEIGCRGAIVLWQNHRRIDGFWKVLVGVRFRAPGRSRCSPDQLFPLRGRSHWSFYLEWTWFQIGLNPHEFQPFVCCEEASCCATCGHHPGVSFRSRISGP